MTNVRALLCVLALFVFDLSATAVQAQSQAPAAKQVPGPVIEMITIWQNASRAPTPEAKVAEIQKALSLARSFDAWPLRSPERDDLLGQMWGQLGNEYRRIRSPARPEALEQAIAAYTQCLKHFTEQKFPDQWARAQYGLGSAYLDRVRGDRADNLEQAIAALNQAKTVLTRDKAPAMWADAQRTLSAALWHRIRGVRADNLEQAIEAGRNALTVLTRERNPSDWSSAQSALGAAYWARIRGDRADNVETAIAAYEQALQVVSREKDARVWAGLQDNLGMALATRVRGDTADNLKSALAAFVRAEEVFARSAYPSEWAQLQMNIGNTALDFEVGPAARRGNVETAIKAYRNALTVYTRQDAPERWARIMVNLGSALVDRQEGDRADNIEKAIDAERDALSFYTRTSDPVKWAIAQANLGEAYRRRTRGDRARNLQAAAEALEAALIVHTPTASPAQHMQVAHAAGEVAALRGDWRTAQSRLASAIAASTLLFGEGLNPIAAERVVRAGGRLFGSAAYVAAELGEPHQALDLLEAGRARLLRAALGLDALALPDADRSRLAGLRIALPELENLLQTATGDERLATLRALEEKRGAIERIISSRLDDATGDPLHVSGTTLARSLLQDYGAIVAPVVTEFGAKLVIVTRGSARPLAEVVNLADLTDSALLRFIRGSPDNDRLGGWLAAYAGMVRAEGDAQGAEKRFLDAVRDLAPSLWRMIGGRIVEALERARVPRDARIVWLPNGALGLLPVGLASPAAATASLFDRNPVVVSPSLSVLESSRRRLQSGQAPSSLAGIINPTGDLAFTELEGATVASYFGAGAQLLQAGDARRDTVLPALKGAGYWHFATHGTFSWVAPRASALLLADKKPLTVGDLLDQVGLGNPRLVLLSACETGLYDFQRAPEEFIGLPSAFLQVGAIGVVGTLWPVNDVSTSLVMMKFYDLHRSSKIEPATALRSAQLWLRDSTSASLRDFVAQMRGNNRLTREQEATMVSAIVAAATSGGERPFSHPFYWAPFQYFGA